MNEKFGLEFSKILERTYIQIKDNLIEPFVPSEDNNLQHYAINSGMILGVSNTTFIGLMSACEILSLYSDINQRCIDHGKAIGRPKNKHFV